MKKILIMAGGTGGHVFPALAVADEMKKQGVEIHWLGTPRGIENKLIPAAKYPLHHIRVTGLVGSGLKKKILVPFTLTKAVVQGIAVILKVKPSVVLGMGGFASGPGGVAAYLLRKPIVIHEQNAVAGMTNYYLAKLAKAVLTGFRDVSNLPEKANWVGNPVREEIYEARTHLGENGAIESDASNENDYINEMSEKQLPKRKILVLGGSQGARPLNKDLPLVFDELSSHFNLDIWHQAGSGNEEDTKANYQNLKNVTNVRVNEFIDDMAAAYQWPDLIICRAGAMTVTEIMAAAKAALFLPYPHAAGDHQTINAQFMVDAGASLISKDAEISSREFIEQVAILLARKDILNRMGEAASFMYRSNAASNTAKVCMEFIDA